MTRRCDSIADARGSAPLELATARRAMPALRACTVASTAQLLARACAAASREKGGRLVALWGERRPRSRRGLRACTSRCRRATGLLVLESPLPDADADVSRSLRHFPGRRTGCSARPSICRRARRDARRPAQVAAPWRAGRSTVSRCARDFDARRRTWRTGPGRRIAFVRVEGEGVHEIPGRAGARRHDRAGAFPLLRSSARRCCGWRSGSATSTRASRSASRR